MNDDSTLVLYDDARTALASRLYFLLALYGFPLEQVKVLNGGWSHWGNTLTLPVVEGAAPYDEAFAL